MTKKKRQGKPVAAGQFRAAHFAALKKLDIARKEPDAVQPPSELPALGGQSAEDDSDLFLQAMADVTALRAQKGSCRGGNSKEAARPAPAAGGDADLFRRAMAGVKSLADPRGTEGKTKTARSPVRGQAPSSSPPLPDDRESAELFLQEIGRLKLESKFADSQPADEELKPLSGNRLRQVKRGIISVSRQLDLHGLTREEALVALPRFLNAARYKGQKAALVITGKGINSPGEPVLQQAVTSWLRDAGREMVLEFAPAPRELGGGGAYVVFLRPLPKSPAAP